MNIPTWLEAIIAIIIALGGALAIIAYGWASGRSGTIKAMKESNDSIRDLLRDKNEEWGNKFDKMDTQLKENILQIGQLQGKVEKLEHQNGDMKRIILESLQDFWKNNPDAAAKFHAKLTKTSN